MIVAEEILDPVVEIPPAQYYAEGEAKLVTDACVRWEPRWVITDAR
jgi:hypothetical protein